MSSAIREALLVPTELGNDPNDNREATGYLEAVEGQPEITWMDEFVLTKREISKIANPTWVFKNLIIQGHLIVIPAPPSGGKTTLFVWIAGEISSEYKVYYVNSDVSGTDAKAMAEQALRDGFTMMLPDIKVGLSMDDVVTNLVNMNRQGGDFSNMVFIFDTLKKMTDVINKSKAKQLFKTLRGLTGKGMTIILLAHTNKHKGEDGKLIFEGTGDIRADADEMIYLESQKHSDKSMTISTVLEKVRGDFEPITFEITADRAVIPSEEYRDIKKASIERQQREKDEEVVEMVKEALSHECVKQQEVINYCKDSGFGAKRVRDVLRCYSNLIWYARRGEKNSWNYELVRSG